MCKARPISLINKLTISYSLSFMLLLGVLLTILYMSVDSILSTEIDEDLQEDIAYYRQLYHEQGVNGVLQKLADEQAENAAENQADNEFMLLYDNQGKIKFAGHIDNGQLAVQPEEILAKLERPLNAQQEFLFDLALAGHDSPMRSIYAKIGPNLILQVTESTEAKQDVLALLLSSFALVFALSLPFAATMNFYLARSATRTLHEMRNAAMAIGQGDFSARVPIAAREKEIRQLALSFNTMATKIQLLNKEMRDITDNIAHDLRSPLGRIRAISEMTLRGHQSIEHYQQSAEDTLQECDRLMGLINTTLDVAEAEAGILRIAKSQVDVSAMMADVCELYDALAHQKQLQLHTDLQDQVQLFGSFPSLQRMVANLIDNGIKYTPPGGKVSVSLRQDDSGTRIVVSDTGIGIASHDRMRVFERFFRGDQSRSQDGSGLGLSYSRAVARAHGGDIQVNSQPDIRTDFIVLLPA